MKLDEMKEKNSGSITKIQGTAEFQRRITSVGLTIENKVEMIQNDKHNPIMMYVRNTTLAMNRRDGANIEVEEIRNGR
ncbi:MAG: ferrous iron transport protein A [Clostridia bacterium]|nr:ferrous iron transport protein A [Clostridia bacterium]